jgi:hypothetical protein
MNQKRNYEAPDFEISFILLPLPPFYPQNTLFSNTVPVLPLENAVSLSAYD